VNNKNEPLKINNDIFNNLNLLIELKEEEILLIQCLNLFFGKIIEIYISIIIGNINSNILEIANILLKYSNNSIINNDKIKNICFRTKKFLLEQKKYDIEKYLFNLSDLCKFIFDEKHM
jgi:hypothetical protein